MVAESVEHIEELTAGQRLQAAREARNIERSEVARWLKLDEKYIRAIEEDDEEHLPGPVFIAGYIRNYAKLVDLSPDQLVQEFTKTHEPETPKIDELPEPVPGRMGKVAESLPKHFRIAANSHPASVKRFVMLSTAIFVMGVVSWIVVFTGEDEAEIASLDESPMVSAPAQAVPTPTSVEPQEITTTAVSPSPATSAEPKLKQPESQSVQTQPPERITVPLELKKLERGDPGVVTALDEQGLSTYADLPKENIAVHFTADSWVEVRDATGKRLIRSLGVAGATKEVRGVAPFQVLIGYGPGVELSYNGEPFDFSKYQGRQEVARFTLNSTDEAPNDKSQATNNE
jgi:cytoskeleton protein RodZ